VPILGLGLKSRSVKGVDSAWILISLIKIIEGTGPNLVLMANIEKEIYKGQPLSFGTW